MVKPKLSGTAIARARSVNSSPAPTKTGKAPRMTKKALLQSELERRRNYAQAFFNEMNETVFGGGIPAGTALEWNKRLLTTAGRAHWRKWVRSSLVEGASADLLRPGLGRVHTSPRSNWQRRSWIATVSL